VLQRSLMTSIYRRLLHDDARGVGEVLNETVCVLDRCEGLTVSIYYALIFTSLVLVFIRGFGKLRYRCCLDVTFLFQIQGKFFLRIDQLGEGAKWRRTFGQEIYSPVLLAFTEQVKK